MDQKDIDTILGIAKMICGVKIGWNIVKDNHCVFEFKERIYTITNMGDDMIKFCKYTGLEVNPPQLIYSFEATYNETAFRSLITRFNTLYK